MQWCRPDVCEGSVVAEDSNTATVQSEQEAGMMVIRKGRYPIDFSDNLTTSDAFPKFIPNDTFASDEKTFTVITGINGAMCSCRVARKFNPVLTFCIFLVTYIKY